MTNKDEPKEKRVTSAELDMLIEKVLARREQVVYSHLEHPNDRLFLVTTMFADQKMPHFEHFAYPEDAKHYWTKLTEGLAGLPQPHCGLFNKALLVAAVHISGIGWGKSEGKYFFQLTQTGDHALCFQYETEEIRDHNLEIFRRFVGIREGSPMPLND